MMKSQECSAPRPRYWARFLPLVGVLLGSSGCGQGDSLNDIPSNGGLASTGGAPGSGGQSTGGMTADCPDGEVVSAKRIVRLSFNQAANSIATLVDDALGARIFDQFELVDAEHRAFPPLQSPREGNSYTDQSWGSMDQIAQAAGDYVRENFSEVTGCDPDGTDDCAFAYLTGLSTKAYRRPLKADELERLETLYTVAFRGEGASIPESVQFGVYAIFQAPQFLYRTEFGDDAQADGPLTQLEMASMLSYFLTDDTPDETLLVKAERGELATKEQVAAQVDRILATESAKTNLHGAMMSYFAYPNLESQIIQDDAFTGEMRASMYREAELFLERTLWSEPLEELLVSRTGFVNETLAPLYDLREFPPPNGVPDEEAFYEIELPANRTGLLTQVGFLANRSRPDHTSVVGRGLLIKNAFLCTETPLPPDGIVEVINQLAEDNPDASEREMADMRASAPACSNCHKSFDAYGLSLDTYDVLGRYREVDDHDRPIDPSVVLPAEVGGGEAANIVEVAQHLAESGAFAKCMGQNLVNYALADVSAGAATINSCAVQRVAQAFETSDGSFPALVRAVATSAVFGERTKGDE